MMWRWSIIVQPLKMKNAKPTATKEKAAERAPGGPPFPLTVIGSRSSLYRAPILRQQFPCSNSPGEREM
jgi:hypothetical protein